MRTTWLLLAGIIVQTSVAGQNTLSSSRRTSVHTYIYKISEKEAYTLYKSGLSKANEKYLHALIDSFKQDKEDIPKLNAGNYLQVYAKDNQLAIELLNEGDVNCKLIDNNRDFFVALHTKEGKMIDDARVYFGRSKVNFDQRLQSYKIPGFRRTGLLRVYKNNAVYFFPVAKNRSGRNFQLQYRSPFKYVIQPYLKAEGWQNRLCQPFPFLLQRLCCPTEGIYELC